MKSKINKIGLVFGSLSIINEIKNGNGRLICECICDCGNYYSDTSSKITTGVRKQCRECSYKNRCYNVKKHMSNHRYKGYKELPLSLFHQFKNGAIRRNIDFNINIEIAFDVYLKQSRKCYFTDIDLLLDSDNCNASLDRIDSKIGYEKNNIIWVYKPINNMKLDFDLKYFIDMCCLISRNNYKILNA